MEQKALAGLLPDDNEGTYRSVFENNEEIEYFGKRKIQNLMTWLISFSNKETLLI